MVNIRLYEDREFRYDILMNVKVCEDRFLYLFHAKNTELILMKFDSSKPWVFASLILRFMEYLPSEI